MKLTRLTFVKKILNRKTSQDSKRPANFGSSRERIESNVFFDFIKNTKKELLRTASRDQTVTAKVVPRKISAGFKLLARKFDVAQTDFTIVVNFSFLLLVE